MLTDSSAVTVPNRKLTKTLTRNSISQNQKDTNQRVNLSNFFHNLLPTFHENDVPKHNTSEKSSDFFQLLAQKAHFCLLRKFTTLTETESASSESKYAIPDLQVYTILKNLGQNNLSYTDTVTCMQKFWHFPKNIMRIPVNYSLKILIYMYFCPSKECIS